MPPLSSVPHTPPPVLKTSAKGLSPVENHQDESPPDPEELRDFFVRLDRLMKRLEAVPKKSNKICN